MHTDHIPSQPQSAMPGPVPTPPGLNHRVAGMLGTACSILEVLDDAEANRIKIAQSIQSDTQGGYPDLAAARHKAQTQQEPRTDLDTLHEYLRKIQRHAEEISTRLSDMI